MGAYENPETFIDTQTPKYYQGLQETIAGSFANVAQSYAAKQTELKKKREETEKILKANDMKANEYSFSMYSDLAKSTASDPSVDWNKTFDPLINEAKNIRLGMLNGSLSNNQDAMKRLAQINASVDSVSKSLATLSAVGTTYLGAVAKGAGVPGGLSTVNDPKTTEAVDVLTQRLPGKKEVFFKDNDPTKLMWRVTNTKGEVLQEFDADQLDKISKGNGLITVIPNLTADHDKIKTTNTNIFDVTTLKDGSTIPNGQVKRDYLSFKSNGQPDGKWEQVGAPGKEVYQFKQNVDINAMKTDSNLITTLKAQAEGILKSNEKEAIALMNDTFASQATKAGNKNAIHFDSNKALTDQEKAEFTNAYMDNFFTSQVPTTQTILKPDEAILALMPENKKETATTATDKSSSLSSIFSASQIEEYGKEFNKIVAGKQDAFEVSVLGPKGGLQKTLHFSKEGNKIKSEETGEAFPSTEAFKNYLRNINKQRERKPLTVSKK
jgi:hypothetical protein